MATKKQTPEKRTPALSPRQSPVRAAPRGRPNDKTTQEK